MKINCFKHGKKQKFQNNKKYLNKININGK